VEPAKKTDQDQVEAVRDGDREAFADIVCANQRGLFFHALRLAAGDQELARDVVQKTFLAAWTHRAEFRGEASIRTWLYRIATNLGLNELRRAHRRREIGATPADSDAPVELGRVEAAAFEELATAEARRHLRGAAERLSPRQRSVVFLRLYEDLSFGEIAEVCEITTNAAKVSFHHGVQNIRRFLLEEGVAS